MGKVVHHELPIETMGPRAPVGEGACQEDPDPEANNRIEGLQKDGRGAAIAFHSKVWQGLGIEK
jgi:hypothetical protein